MDEVNLIHREVKLKHWGEGMKTRDQEHKNATNSQGQMIDDPDLIVSRFFALLYSVDQRNKEEKDVSNKICAA